MVGKRFCNAALGFTGRAETAAPYFNLFALVFLSFDSGHPITYVS
jgi:hypothetical protein